MEDLISLNLFVPDKTKLARIVQNELSTDFEEITVEWVDCPDLTEDPFNLVAPGLCGDTALFDIGGISNIFPYPKRNKVFYFKNILRELNRTQSDNFILGGGLCVRQSDEYLGELIMNASFSPDGTKDKNESRFASLQLTKRNITTEEFVLEPLTDTNPNCNLYGNFFVSNGLREQVLKVRAKKQFGRSFIDALQQAIRRFPSNSQLMGFGGTFVVKNGTTTFHVIRNHWVDPLTKRLDIYKCIKYHEVTMPSLVFATFVNADRHNMFNMNKKSKQIFLTRSHSYICSNDGGGYYHRSEQNDNSNIEYLGYFSSATKLYRINSVPMFYEIPNFSCLLKH